jgi:elongation of very long chain fatty acids protein 6
MDPATFDLNYTHKGLFISRSGFNHTFTFFYERKHFDGEFMVPLRQWIMDHWHLSIIYAFVYVVAVFGGQAFMKNRVKMDLRRELIAWNLVLSLFSLFGAIRLIPEFMQLVSTYGIDYSVCSGETSHGVSGHWNALFAASKFPELFDTFFIVARKQKLIFLHWYHHTTVIVAAWYTVSQFSPVGRWFAMMNFSVHAVMYGYYALKAMSFNIPKFVNVTITTMQLTQMVVGIYVNYTAFLIKWRGEPCDVSDENLQLAFLMYLSYFCLFFNFFYKAYLSLASKKNSSKTE